MAVNLDVVHVMFAVVLRRRVRPLLGVGVRRGVEDGEFTGQLTLEKLVLQLHVAIL